jgi:hypothetical protein
MQTKNAEALPKIRGAVCAQWREYKGKRLGPYYFLCWREGGKLRKRYVKPADLAATIAACAANREEQRERRRSRAELMQWIHDFNRTSREVERWVKAMRSSR